MSKDDREWFKEWIAQAEKTRDKLPISTDDPHMDYYSCDNGWGYIPCCHCPCCRPCYKDYWRPTYYYGTTSDTPTFWSSWTT